MPTTKEPQKKRNLLQEWLLLILIVLPLIAGAVITYTTTYRDQTNFIYDRRAALAELAGITLVEQLDRIVDVGTAVAGRPIVQKLVSEGKWRDAALAIEDVPRNFTFINTVSFYSAEGNLMTGVPNPDDPVMQSVVGRNFATRDHYIGVTKNWEPFVTGVFKSLRPPHDSLISVAVPIKATDGKALGYILMLVRLDTITGWIKNIDVGEMGYVYIVDQKGQLVAHPNVTPATPVVEYTAVPEVARMLAGEDGIAIFIDPLKNERNLSAYQSVSKYGWGVIVAQPEKAAFAERNKTVTLFALIWVLIILFVAYFSRRILLDRATIRAQRDLEETFLESIGDGVVAIDANFIITKWNRAATAIMGWSEKEALGKPMREIMKFVREADKVEDSTFIEEAMRQGRSQESTDLLLVTRGSRLIHVGSSAAPVIDMSGKTVGIIIVFRNTTSEYELGRARSEFVSIASHQLRTPLTSMRWFSEMLLDGDAGKITKEQKNFIEHISQGAERMIELVNLLLQIARVEAGKVKVEPVPTDLKMITEAIVLTLQTELKAKLQRIEVILADTIPLIPMEQEYVWQIIQNLLTNAIRYSPVGSTITVTFAQKNDWIVMAVKDQGIGIPEDQQAKVFEKFFRADNARALVPEGSGLGLSLIKTLVADWGGEVWFESVVGQGTTFFVTIPIAGMKARTGSVTLAVK